MKTTGDYHNLYLKTDVLLLADVFEEFRSVCIGNYKFDSWYYTAPGLAWDAALKETDVQLELLTDVDMLLMIEKGIRGGVLGGVRIAYDETKPKKSIAYLDANNLYGWALCQSLPVRGFKWMADLDNWREIPCILEVDFEYPKRATRYSQRQSTCS